MSRELVTDDGVIRRYRVLNAQGVEIGWDVEHVPTVEEQNATTLRERVEGALTTNAAFLAIASPTNAQNAAQVKTLTRQMSGLIRLTLSRTESTEGS